MRACHPPATSEGASRGAPCYCLPPILERPSQQRSSTRHTSGPTVTNSHLPKVHNNSHTDSFIAEASKNLTVLQNGAAAASERMDRCMQGCAAQRLPTAVPGTLSPGSAPPTWQLANMPCAHAACKPERCAQAMNCRTCTCGLQTREVRTSIDQACLRPRRACPRTPCHCLPTGCMSVDAWTPGYRPVPLPHQAGRATQCAWASMACGPAAVLGPLAWALISAC